MMLSCSLSLLEEIIVIVKKLSYCCSWVFVADFCFSLRIYSPVRFGNWKDKAVVRSILENLTPRRHLQLIYSAFHPRLQKSVREYLLIWRAVETSIGTDQCKALFLSTYFVVVFPFPGHSLSCLPLLSSCLFNHSSLSPNSSHFSAIYSMPDKHPNYENYQMQLPFRVSLSFFLLYSDSGTGNLVSCTFSNSYFFPNLCNETVDFASSVN